jgi:hypothetical protein
MKHVLARYLRHVANRLDPQPKPSWPTVHIQSSIASSTVNEPSTSHLRALNFYL